MADATFEFSIFAGRETCSIISQNRTYSLSYGTVAQAKDRIKAVLDESQKVTSSSATISEGGYIFKKSFGSMSQVSMVDTIVSNARSAYKKLKEVIDKGEDERKEIDKQIEAKRNQIRKLQEEVGMLQRKKSSSSDSGISTWSSSTGYQKR